MGRRRDNDNGHAAQIAALPVRWDDKGKLRVLMVTSRGTGRWVLPKGWMIDGCKPWRAAEIEALEEAGARGHIGATPLGTYAYDKLMDDGTSVPCLVTVYPMHVERLKRRWKERDERERRWFSPKGAAKRVDEPDLKRLLLDAGAEPRKNSTIRKLLAA